MKNKKILYMLIFVVVGWIFYKFIDATYLEKQRIYSYGEMYLKEKDYLTAIDRFEEIKGFKDSDKRIQQTYKMMMKKSMKLLNDGDLYDAGVLLDVLAEVPEYKEQAETASKKADELAAKYLAERREKLRDTEPYDGMAASDIDYSGWGPPTTIERDVNYYSYRKERQVEHYKWITQDQFGRITQIKTLMVRQGAVWGEPSVSNYYVGQ
ncbi:hypothetical protein AB7942_30205 [Neobacillus sp. BF23-41]|uniref:hypothetical protein n=1 Tax=Neobacillus sp. BF23-41 TaxID=3240280 RepID=UPI0034E4D105